MTNSEQIVASLINNNRITGEEAIALLRAIYGKEKTVDSSISKNYWKTDSDVSNVYKHTDVLCANTSINTVSNDNANTAVYYSSDM